MKLITRIFETRAARAKRRQDAENRRIAAELKVKLILAAWEEDGIARVIHRG